MSGPKQAMNERIARQKATQQRVFISDLKGTHTLETGVAYHYRGHFIYAYPAGNPIEPVPFSTKKGIKIVGIAKDRAPDYDPMDPDLGYESSVLALDKACAREWEAQREGEERRKAETKKVLEEEEEDAGTQAPSHAEPENKGIKSVHDNSSVVNCPPLKTDTQHPVSNHPPSRTQSFATLLVPPQVASRLPSRNTSRASFDQVFAPRPATSASSSSSAGTNVPRIGTVEAPPDTHCTSGTDPKESWTPHDRGQYLAYSAPGSRKGSVDNTPWRSRSGSPSGGFGILGHEHGLSYGLSHQDMAIRPVASTSRLAQLLTDEGIQPSFTLGPSSHVHPSTTTSSNSTLQDDENMIANLSFAQEWIDPSDISAFVETVSRRPSRPSSRPLSRTQSPSPLTSTPEEEMEGGLYLPGLGHPDHRRKPSTRPHTRASSPSYASAEAVSTLYISVSRTGRPRAASRVLNQAYNAANAATPRPGFAFQTQELGDTLPSTSTALPTTTTTTTTATEASKAESVSNNSTFTPRCPLHDDGCDGSFVAEEHLTLREWARSGLEAQRLPTIEGVGGRIMVDWAALRDMERMRGGGGIECCGERMRGLLS